MHVLIATNELQGLHPTDYAWTVEGELVTAEATECADADRCGCGRGFPGLASSRATTTAMVADLPHISVDDLRGAILDWLDRSGWRELLAAAVDDTGDDQLDVNDQLGEIADEHVETITQICALFEPGTVIEREGCLVRARAYPAAA